MAKRRPEAVSLNPDKLRDKRILDYIESVAVEVGTPKSEQFKRAMEFYMAHSGVSNVKPPFPKSPELNNSEKINTITTLEVDTEKPLLGENLSNFNKGFTAVTSDRFDFDDDED